jgi:hypothetical protein
MKIDECGSSSAWREKRSTNLLALSIDYGKWSRRSSLVMVGFPHFSFPRPDPIMTSLVPPFPTDMFSDLSNAGDNPNIYITSPTTPSRYPPPLSINFNQSLQSMQSPSSSPTSTDFPHSHHTHSSLSRQHSYQHVGFGAGAQPSSSSALPTDASDTANASSPSAMEGVYEDDSGSAGGLNGTQASGPRGSAGVKRPRLSTDENGMTAMSGLGVNVNMNGYHHHMVVGHRAQYAAAARPPHQHHLAGDVSTVSSPGTTAPPSSLLGMPGITVTGGVKKNSRARSDSAPLGPYSYASSGTGNPASGGNLSIGSSWLGGRPRSGSGLVTVPRPGTGNNIGMGMGRNMGNLSSLANINSAPSSNANVAGQQTGSASGPNGEAATQGPGGPASAGNANSLMSGSVVSDGSGR